MTAPTPSRHAERLESQKHEAAERAVQFVESGMVVGLGAGSTAAFALRRIAELLRQGQLRDVVGIPCSSEVGENARQLGIPSPPSRTVGRSTSPSTAPTRSIPT